MGAIGLWRDENGPGWKRPKIMHSSSRKAKNGLMGARNKNGRFWWRRLDTAPTYGIMVKRVQRSCGGMKMAPSENGQKSFYSSRKAKNRSMGAWNENSWFRWKQLETSHGRSLWKWLETTLTMVSCLKECEEVVQGWNWPLVKVAKNPVLAHGRPKTGRWMSGMKTTDFGGNGKKWHQRMVSCSNGWKHVVEQWKWLRVKTAKNHVLKTGGLIGAQNKNGQFRLKWLEMARTHTWSHV